jgi:cellulose synthase/poly-beta-1,6-N-acetylglucosamine synthase-like glycosyltransferase
MNTTMGLSLRVEEIMDERRPTDLDDLAHWTVADEDRLYQGALDSAIAEGGNLLWANGNIRIGEFILIIDSDTRVPKDCLLDGATEMRQCPEVGVIQHASGTFLAGAGYFENYISFFTTCVNHAISFGVANGSSAPFVYVLLLPPLFLFPNGLLTLSPSCSGHNAFLRWEALQLQAVDNPEGKVWSESHVSEDFVMTLCLNRTGYITRWATYSKGGFKEGVSLTCDDELNRWQK